MFRLKAPSHDKLVLSTCLRYIHSPKRCVFKSVGIIGYQERHSIEWTANACSSFWLPASTKLFSLIYGNMVHRFEPYRYPTTPDDPEHDVIPSSDTKEGFSLISKRSLHPPTYYKAKCFLHTIRTGCEWFHIASNIRTAKLTTMISLQFCFALRLPFQKHDLPPPPASNGMATPR